METRCRFPIWWTFGRIQWHVIPQPRFTLQGAATWWIHCHDSIATCHSAGCSYLTKSISWSCHIAGSKNSIRHIENRFFAIILLAGLRVPCRYCFYSLAQKWVFRPAGSTRCPDKRLSEQKCGNTAPKTVKISNFGQKFVPQGRLVCHILRNFQRL